MNYTTYEKVRSWREEVQVEQVGKQVRSMVVEVQER